MTKPCGLLLAASALSPDVVSQALVDQGGPEWDETVFRLLTGVDVASLAVGPPKAGAGTAVSVASSGWWLRRLDDLAQRIADASGAPVLAAFSSQGDQSSGYALATPGKPMQYGLTDGLNGWADGVAELLGAPLVDGDRTPLSQAAVVVHNNAAEGKDLPSVFLFSAEADVDRMVRIRGEALVAGLAWRPVHRRDPLEAPPPRMKAIVLSSPMRLPGPPRWARATRAVAVEAAKAAVADDGWVCLLRGELGRHEPYGTAVQVLQLAPLPDGSWVGALHPRCAVRIEEANQGVADVQIVPQAPKVDTDALRAAVDDLAGKLEGAEHVRWSADELHASDDPAGLIGWQIKVPEALCQRYLRARDPVERVRAVIEALG